MKKAKKFKKRTINIKEDFTEEELDRVLLTPEAMRFVTMALEEMKQW